MPQGGESQLTARNATAQEREDFGALAGAAAGPRVLLVDDNEDLAKVTAVLLRQCNAQVRHARDAGRALRLVTAHLFDVVLTDVVMPGGMDGVAVAHRLRSRHPALPVVLIGGHSTATSAEGFPILRKPCLPEASFWWL
jgi:CheY-like chemotaxis protein